MRLLGALGLHRESEGAYLLSKGEIGSVGVRHQTRLFNVQLALLVDEVLCDIHGGYLRDEHIMRALRQDLSHLALDGDGSLSDLRRGDRVAFLRVELHLAELILVLSGLYAAVVKGAHKRGRHHVDDELAAFLDDIIGISLRSY